MHALDVGLSNHRVHGDAGKPRISLQSFRFPNDLEILPLLLPGCYSDAGVGFHLLYEQHGLRCHVLAQVDDMALLRLLARDSGAVALVPTVVVREELQSRQPVEHCVVPDLVETFYAIKAKRHFEPPLLKALLGRDEADVLDMAG